MPGEESYNLWLINQTELIWEEEYLLVQDTLPMVTWWVQDSSSLLQVCQVSSSTSLSFSFFSFWSFILDSNFIWFSFCSLIVWFPYSMTTKGMQSPMDGYNAMNASSSLRSPHHPSNAMLLSGHPSHAAMMMAHPSMAHPTSPYDSGLGHGMDIHANWIFSGERDTSSSKETTV